MWVLKGFSALARDLRLSRCLCCGCCSAHGIELCDDCRRVFPANQVCCKICSIPLISDGLCGNCQRQPPAYDKIYAPFVYGYPIDRLIGDYKHCHSFAAGLALTHLLADMLGGADMTMPDLIVPVPLHWTRQWQRGFNQTIWMAKRLGRLLNCATDDRLLTRIKRGQPQQSLSREKRLKNIRGSFVCTADLAGTHVALLDDVVTTGATAQEASGCLKAAGAGRVDVWCLARTPLER